MPQWWLWLPPQNQPSLDGWSWLAAGLGLPDQEMIFWSSNRLDPFWGIWHMSWCQDSIPNLMAVWNPHSKISKCRFNGGALEAIRNQKDAMCWGSGTNLRIWDGDVWIGFQTSQLGNLCWYLHSVPSLPPPLIAWISFWGSTAIQVGKHA